jgi:uncharacterized RDD family membrane protein YckC
MRSFLLSPFKHQAKVASLVSLLLVMALYALVVLTSIDGWNTATDDFRKWNSGQGERCERLFSDAEKEVAAIDRGRCELKGDFAAYSQCKDADKARRVQLVDATVRSDCPAYSIGRYGDIPVLVPKHPPGPLPVYALESKGMYLPILPVAFVGLTFVLLLLGDFSKRVLTDGHSGWKRLSLVTSVLSGAAVAGWWFHEGEGGGETLVASIVSLCVVGAAFVYGRLVFRWVADGFSAEGEITVAIPSASPRNAFPEPSPGHAVIESDMPEKQAAAVAARFWPRLWARCVDLTLCWFAGSVVAAFLPDIRSTLPGTGGILVDLLVGMVFICGAVFLYESFFLSRFGATPGKMLFGISVSSIDGGLPSAEASKRRAWIFLKSGLYLCFYVPILQVFGAIAAWRRRDGSQPWDLAARTFTSQKPIGFARLAVAAVLAFCMFAFMVGASKMAKETTKEGIHRSILG